MQLIFDNHGNPRLTRLKRDDKLVESYAEDCCKAFQDSATVEMLKDLYDKLNDGEWSQHYRSIYDEDDRWWYANELDVAVLHSTLNLLVAVYVGIQSSNEFIAEPVLQHCQLGGCQHFGVMPVCDACIAEMMKQIKILLACHNYCKSSRAHDQ
jgi:hypothetical protein